MAVKKLNRNIFQRILGRQVTPLPETDDFWVYSDGVVTIQTAKTEQLSGKSGAVRLEGNGLPKKLLVVHGEDGQYYAFHNACSHAGRGLDPVPGTNTVQCCSIGTSTFDYQGELIEGSAQKGIETFAVEQQNGNLVIRL